MNDVTRPRHGGGDGHAPSGGAECDALPPASRAEDPSETAEAPVAVGLRVGRLLGRGGSSTVWLVTDDGGRQSALKVVRAPAATSASAADVEQELRLLQRFAHEHLLRVHRVVHTDRGPGLLMDLAKGGSLLGLVTSRGPLPIPEVVTALVPVAQALDFLHGAGALHGDVTPANILFTEEGKPLLGDFGTGRVLGSPPGAIAGTPGFLDPARQGSFDPGADVFALAAVAWFALTGRVPGPTEQRPPLALIVPEVPPQLVQLIEDGLDVDRDCRPTADRFARTLLASAVPAPVDLVAAVHASVLPELLTRRADTPTAVPSRWERVTRRAVPRRRRNGDAPSGARPGRPSRHGVARGDPGTGRRRARRAGRARAAITGGRQARGALGVLAGLVAVALLLAGIALTLGWNEPRELADGSTPAGQPEGTGQEDPTPDGLQGGPLLPADSSPPEGPPTVDPATVDPATVDPATEDPVTALDRLAARRATAFGRADPAILADVDVQGSPAMSTDVAAVTALADTGTVLRDLSIDIRDAVVLSGADLAALPQMDSLPAVAAPPGGTEVAVVRATAAVSSYTEATSAPPPPDPRPSPLTAAGRQELVFVLWSTEPGWRIHSVVSPPG